MLRGLFSIITSLIRSLKIHDKYLKKVIRYLNFKRLLIKQRFPRVSLAQTMDCAEPQRSFAALAKALLLHSFFYKPYTKQISYYFCLGTYQNIKSIYLGVIN
jgi:hypothetical protein